MSLVLGLTALAHELVPQTSATVFFAVTQGLWFGLVGLAASLCLQPLLPALPALALSVLCALNGISLATIGFPHIEIAIPALVLLISGMLDTGIPACCLGARAAATHNSRGRWSASRDHFCVDRRLALACVGLRRAARTEAIMATVGLLSAALLLAVQQTLFVGGVDQLHETYLGTPMLAHVNWAFLGHRIYLAGPEPLLHLSAISSDTHHGRAAA